MKMLMFAAPLSLALQAHAIPRTPLEDLAGQAWQSRCAASDEPLTRSEANELQMIGEYFAASDVYFDSRDCTGTPVVAFRTVYAVSSVREEVRDNIEHKALFELKLHAERVLVTTAAMASHLNSQSYCGITDWKAGEERACPLTTADPRPLFMRTTINQLAGQEVLEAAFSFEGRPTKVGQLWFRFTADHDELKPEPWAYSPRVYRAPATAFAPELEGAPWVYACSERDSEVYGSGHEDSVEVVGQKFIRVEKSYADRGCLGTLRLTVKQVAVVSESASREVNQETWQSFRAKTTEIRYLPGVKLVAEYFNEHKICGRTNWAAGVEQSCPPAKDIHLAAIYQLGEMGGGQMLSLGLEMQSHTPPAAYPNAASFYGWRVDAQPEPR